MFGRLMTTTTPPLTNTTLLPLHCRHYRRQLEPNRLDLTPQIHCRSTPRHCRLSSSRQYQPTPIHSCQNLKCRCSTPTSHSLPTFRRFLSSTTMHHSMFHCPLQLSTIFDLQRSKMLSLTTTLCLHRYRCFQNQLSTLTTLHDQNVLHPIRHTSCRCLHYLMCQCSALTIHSLLHFQHSPSTTTAIHLLKQYRALSKLTLRHRYSQRTNHPQVRCGLRFHCCLIPLSPKSCLLGLTPRCPIRSTNCHCRLSSLFPCSTPTTRSLQMFPSSLFSTTTTHSTSSSRIHSSRSLRLPPSTTTHLLTSTETHRLRCFQIRPPRRSTLHDLTPRSHFPRTMRHCCLSSTLRFRH